MDSFTTAGLLFPADKFDLRQRSNLIDLDRQLNKHWALGKNSILAWAAADAGLLLLVVPHYAIADYALAAQATSSQHGGPGSDPYEFIMRLLTGSRQFTSRQLENAARLLGAELAYARLRQPLSGEVTECQIIDRLVRRYSASFVPSRAVALFDIVGFSLLTPFEQMTQLNSLSHSLNSAHSKMLGQRIDMNFARSSTGDGFYIWNRDIGVQANTNLYHFMHLALASNAIARRKARGRTVPLLRVAFHVGPCYEFHQAEGLNPTIHHDIVGDVTIELARMVERALPGQILVGDFEAILPVAEDSGAECIQLDSIQFVDRAQMSLAALNGLVFSGEAIESIKCYLTGRAQPDGTFTIRKLAINDKHGLTRTVFNAKINIYRRSAEPILLGIEDKLLRGDDLPARTSEHIELRGKRH
jgi:hypothetical protein